MALWALGASTLWNWLLERVRRLAPDKPATAFTLRLSAVAGAALILTMAATSAYLYFTRWAIDPERYYDFNAYAVDTARAAATTPAQDELYISEEYYRHATYLYLEPRTEQARWFDARSGWPIAPAGRRSIFFVPYTTPVSDALAQPLVRGAQGRNALDPAGQYSYTSFVFPAGSSPPAPANRFKKVVGPLRLDGYDLTPAGGREPFVVTLHWRVMAPSERQLRVFVHLVDDAGRVVAQQDGLGFEAPEWRAGDQFADFHTITPPGDLPAGEYRLLVGMYDIATGERLPIDGARDGAVALPTEIQLR
jgi:hypothetical protein